MVTDRGLTSMAAGLELCFFHCPSHLVAASDRHDTGTTTPVMPCPAWAQPSTVEQFPPGLSLSVLNSLPVPADPPWTTPVGAGLMCMVLALPPN